MAKEIIETIINTSALALTSAGTTFLITERDYFGFLLILYGASLEFAKYFGRGRLWGLKKKRLLERRKGT